MEQILRRSDRLVVNGYYTPDGKPTISYKESRIRKWTYRRFYHTERRDSSSTNNTNSNSSIDRDLLMYTLKRFLISAICLALFYGFTIIIAPLTMEPAVSSPTIINAVSVPGCEDKGGQLEEVKEGMGVLEKKVDYLLPPADMMPNFALKSQGAKVLSWMPSGTHPGQIQRCSRFGFTIERPSIHPDIVIEGRTRLQPGECWAFEGSQGHLVITLPYRVVISHVTLGHPPKMLSPTGNIDSAPKEFSVYGTREPKQEWTHLGTFLYEEDGEPLQTFVLPSQDKVAVSVIKLQINTNWGNMEHTCLYNFRVHGEIA